MYCTIVAALKHNERIPAITISMILKLVQLSLFFCAELRLMKPFVLHCQEAAIQLAAITFTTCCDHTVQLMYTLMVPRCACTLCDFVQFAHASTMMTIRLDHTAQ
jgi:hypothetical protein